MQKGKGRQGGREGKRQGKAGQGEGQGGVRDPSLQGTSHPRQGIRQEGWGSSQGTRGRHGPMACPKAQGKVRW